MARWENPAALLQHLEKGIEFGVSMSLLMIAIWILGGDPIVTSRGGATADVRIALAVFLVGSPLSAIRYAATAKWHDQTVLSFFAGVLIVTPLTMPMVAFAVGGHSGPVARISAAVATTLVLGAVLAHSAFSD